MFLLVVYLMVALMVGYGIVALASGIRLRSMSQVLAIPMIGCGVFLLYIVGYGLLSSQGLSLVLLALGCALVLSGVVLARHSLPRQQFVSGT